MSFGKVIENGIKRIYSEDKDRQIQMLKVLQEERFMDIEYLISLGAFYVPEDDYMLKFFGQNIKQLEYDCYYGDLCKWTLHLVLPLRNCNGEIVSLLGFNPLHKIIKKQREITGEDLDIPPKYITSSQSLTERGTYMLIPNGVPKMIKDGYCIIVDGFFDALTLGSMGFNTVSALSSMINDKNLFVLSFVKRKYVAYDNDRAGLSLYRYLERRLTNVKSITQGKCKDIDDYVTEYGSDYVKTVLQKSLNSKSFIPVVL